MKILIRNIDSVVLFAGNDLELTDECLFSNEQNYRVDYCTLENSTLETVGSLPEGFKGGMYKYILPDTGWVIHDMDAYNAAVLAAYKATVPERIERLQARIQLIILQKWALIQPIINTIPDPIERAIAQAYFEDARTWKRDDQFVLMIAPAIGLSEHATDEAFIAAAKLAN